jgi:hypothetical protein
MADVPSLAAVLVSLDLARMTPVVGKGFEQKVREAPPPPISEWTASGAFESEDKECPLIKALAARIVHEWATDGFWADVIVPEGQADDSTEIAISLQHKLLGKDPVRVAIHMPAASVEPVQYVRLKGFIEEWPLHLRIYRPGRVRDRSLIRTEGAGNSIPAFRVSRTAAGVVAEEAVGYLSGDRFRELIAPGTKLPCVVSRRFVTARAFQQKIVVIPAISRSTARIDSLSRICVAVAPAEAKVAWLQVTFRVDPDGRLTVICRNPLRDMQIEDVHLFPCPRI